MLVGTFADENLAHDPAMKARYILICVILHNAYLSRARRLELKSEKSGA